MMTRSQKNFNRSVSFKEGEDQECETASSSNSKSNGYYLPPSAGKGLKSSPSMATLSRLERQHIVLWKRPVQTLNYFVCELFLQLYENLSKLRQNKLLVACLSSVCLLLYCLYVLPGPHAPLVAYLERKTSWCIYWIFLGVLSSVGLGTGLHTFLLYLGPHIASVTLAAYECQSLRFPEPPYPDQILCPGDGLAPSGGARNMTTTSSSPGSSSSVDDLLDSTISTLATSSMISLWSIMSKVRVEAFMWGAGTALGELPPYFMARAARLSGEEPDDEEYREFLEFKRQLEEEKLANSPLAPAVSVRKTKRDWWAEVKLGMQKLIESVGFFGILLCASIPNPLFDLAGITCGHFLVPFWTFFGATLIGKAVIKMHIQKLFVILAFSEHHVERCVNALKYVPKIGRSLQSPFKELLAQQKLKLHGRLANNSNSNSIGGGMDEKQQQKILATAGKTNFLQKGFELLVVGMIAYFVVSLINSLAQNYDKRVFQRKQLKKRRAD